MSIKHRSAIHVRAIGKHQEISKALDDLDAQRASLLETRYLLERFIVTFEGCCHECQNPHWPHCPPDAPHKNAS